MPGSMPGIRRKDGLELFREIDDMSGTARLNLVVVYRRHCHPADK